MKGGRGEVEAVSWRQWSRVSAHGESVAVEKLQEPSNQRMEVQSGQ